MKAEYEYSSEDVLALILKAHSLQVSPPDGMVWTSSFNKYGGQTVTIEAVEKEPEGGAT